MGAWLSFPRLISPPPEEVSLFLPIFLLCAGLFVALGLVGIGGSWVYKDAIQNRLHLGVGVLLIVAAYVLLFATVYASLSAFDPKAFSIAGTARELTRLDAFYFALTTAATVGYGDIYPATETARLCVTLQLGSGLVLFVEIAGVAVSRLSASRATD